MSPGVHDGITSAHFINLCYHTHRPRFHDQVRSTQPRLYSVIHIIISEQAAPARKVKVPEGTQIPVNNLALFCIADFKKRVCVFYPYNDTIQNLVSPDNPDLLKALICNIGKLIVRGIPDIVSLKTEVFSYKNSLSFRSHFPAPIRRLVNSAERYLLFRNINPGLVGSPSFVDQNSCNNKVPEHKLRNGFQHRGGSRGVQEPDQRCDWNGRYEYIP